MYSAAVAAPQDAEMAPAPAPKELFYTEGPQELKAARMEIARYSLQRASARLAEQRHRQTESSAEMEEGSLEALGAFNLGNDIRLPSTASLAC